MTLPVRAKIKRADFFKPALYSIYKLNTIELLFSRYNCLSKDRR